ncbi:hypothetical protein FQN57_007398 [Myotisia sp. PD_48]|nr:hypothetical protein FQN57_007398 [Myotisia sp. PD_48]
MINPNRVSLSIVRFDSRHFVYYHPHGDGILAGNSEDNDSVSITIPNEPAKYKEWLETQRAIYAELTAKVKKHNCVTEEEMQGLVDDEHCEIQRIFSWPPRWKSILDDDKLRVLPISPWNSGNATDTKWVFIIDLDYEYIAINNHLFFNLWNVPRDGWMDDFEDNKRGLYRLSPEKHPQDSITVHPPSYFTDEGQRDKYHDLYQQYRHCRVTVKRDVDALVGPPRQLISIALFEGLFSPATFRYRQYLPQWGDEFFAFRELAFAILSFAAGKYSFIDLQRIATFSGVGTANGFLVDEIANDQLDLIPVFGFGCHLPGQAPGSSPCTSLYFLDNILVSLVPNRAIELDEGAVIAKAVEFGIAAGKVNFRIIVFSILNAILIEVSIGKDGKTEIKRTDCIPIYHSKYTRAEDDNLDRYGNPPANPTVFPQRHPGFLALQMFFRTEHNWTPSAWNRGIFPAEIYAEIFSHLDCQTLNTCAKVSYMFQQLCPKQFLLGDDLEILKFKLYPFDPDPYSQIHQIFLNRLGEFTFQSLKTGLVATSSVDQDQLRSSLWCPTIGEGARLSVMTALQLPISGSGFSLFGRS